MTAPDKNDTGWNFGKTWVGDRFEFLVCNGTSGCENVGNSGFFATYLNQWVHTAGVFNSGETIQLYLNGNLTVNESTTITSIHTSEDIPLLQPTIGRRSGEAQSNWNGTIDEVSIFNRSLSASEINSIYLATRTEYLNNSEISVTINTSSQLIVDQLEGIQANISTFTNISCAAFNSTLIIPYFCWISLDHEAVKTQDWNSNCELVN